MSLSHVWLLAIHSLQPTRLLRPWDSPGKNTGVGGMPSSRGSSWSRIEPMSLMSPALASAFFITKSTWEASIELYVWYQFSSVQSLSHVWLFATPRTTASQASLSITNSQSLPRLMSIELVMPSTHLILSSPSPPAFNLSQHQGLFQGVISSHKMAKILEFQLQHQFFQWIFRTGFL